MNSITTHQTSNVQSSTLPVIAGHEIAMDEHGRFNLNAIHKASDAGQTKRPSVWRATKQAQELIGELEDQSQNSGFAPLEAKHGGKTPGTFAHELLAVSYAGWISPRFQLQVNQVFLDYRMGKLQAKPQICALPRPLTPNHQRGIQKAVSRKAQSLPKDAQRLAYSRLYSHLKDRFEVGSYKDIDDSRYTEALGAVQSFDIEGDWMPKQEQDGATFTDDDLSDMYILLCHAHIIEQKWRESRVEEALRILQSPIGGILSEHVSMAGCFSRRIAKAKGQLMERSRERLGLNYGLIPIH